MLNCGKKLPIKKKKKKKKKNIMNDFLNKIAKLIIGKLNEYLQLPNSRRISQHSECWTRENFKIIRDLPVS